MENFSLLQMKKEETKEKMYIVIKYYGNENCFSNGSKSMSKHFVH